VRNTVKVTGTWSVLVAIVLLSVDSPAYAQSRPGRERIPANAPDVQQRIAELSSPDPVTRAAAAYALSRQGRQHAAAIPILIALLGDETAVDPRAYRPRESWMDKSGADAFVSQRSSPGEEAANTLGGMGSNAVEPLIAVLSDNRWLVRKRAACALGEIREAAAVDALSGALKDPEQEVRKEAALALGEIRDRRAVEALVEALKDESAEVRRHVAGALGEIRSAAAVEALSAALNDQDREVRKAAAQALGEIRDRRAVEALIEALKDEYSEVRAQAARALGEIGDARAASALTARLHDQDSHVRTQAARALKELRRD